MTLPHQDPQWLTLSEHVLANIYVIQTCLSHARHKRTYCTIDPLNNEDMNILDTLIHYKSACICHLLNLYCLTCITTIQMIALCVVAIGTVHIGSREWLRNMSACQSPSRKVISTYGFHGLKSVPRQMAGTIKTRQQSCLPCLKEKRSQFFWSSNRTPTGKITIWSGSIFHPVEAQFSVLQQFEKRRLLPSESPRMFLTT